MELLRQSLPLAVLEAAEERDVPERFGGVGRHGTGTISRGQGGRQARRTESPCRLRPISTRPSTWSSPGRRPSSRSASGRSTSTDSIPYLGKFVPQLAEVFLERYARPGALVWDPFAGSGTALVEANAFGVRAAGCDVSAFNCLLTRVKTARYEPEALLADVVLLAAEGDATDGRRRSPASPYLERWFAPRALAELLAFRARIAGDDVPRALERRSLPRGALGPARPPRRSRLPARGGRGRVLLPQAPPGVQARRRGGEVPAPLRPRRGPARPGVRRGAARDRRRRPPRRRAGARST